MRRISREKRKQKEIKKWHSRCSRKRRGFRKNWKEDFCSSRKKENGRR